jgi:uncharacterized LabA/DUF88 family protein
VIDRLLFLVDYDNVLPYFGGRPLLQLVQHIEAKVPEAFIRGFTRLEFRFYGGWTEVRALTRIAQRLSSDIQGNFPSPITRLEQGKSTSRITNAALAKSPLALPAEELKGTFARDRSARKLFCISRPWVGCSKPSSCPLNSVETFLRDSACSHHGCQLSPADVFRRDEQKQVDTLIVADLSYLALAAGATHVVLVSSDADMWPGILTCLSAGVSVLHVHTRPGGSTPPFLSNNARRMQHLYFETSV